MLDTASVLTVVALYGGLLAAGFVAGLTVQWINRIKQAA